MSKIKILVVDDHPLVHFGVINQLKTSDDFVVVGEAEDGEDAIAKTKTLAPDLVIWIFSCPEFPVSRRLSC
jgi:DNA-binding NarL/FixJ family response regulator